MSWTASDIPGLHGRVAVVTGANGGLGLETARELARAGAEVVMAARNAEKAAAAEADVRATVPDAAVRVAALDLASLASVRGFAEAFLAGTERLDLLVNNAGVMAVPEQRTEDGFEMQLGVNHLGHFALTAMLLPALLRADAARVVNVTSTARHAGRPVDRDDPHLRGKYGAWSAYGQSKLANLHFTLGLQQQCAAAGVRASSLVAHPGLSDTNLQAVTVQESGGAPVAKFFHLLAARTGMSAASGALPQLRAATDPAARGGQLYAPRFGNFGPPVRRPLVGRSRNQRSIDTLWEVSERETGIVLDVGAVWARLDPTA